MPAAILKRWQRGCVQWTVCNFIEAQQTPNVNGLIQLRPTMTNNPANHGDVGPRSVSPALTPLVRKRAGKLSNFEPSSTSVLATSVQTKFSGWMAEMSESEDIQNEPTAQSQAAGLAGTGMHISFEALRCLSLVAPTNCCASCVQVDSIPHTAYVNHMISYV